MGGFRFAHNELLYLLLIIPVLAGLFIIGWQIKKQKIKKFGNPELIKQLMPMASSNRPVVKFILFTTALVFLILALAGPQFGSKLQDVKRQGVELIICLDVSNSMMAEDIQPNRLERAKRAISRLLDRLNNDKIGLVVFAGSAYTQLPITTDYASAKMFLSSVTTDIVPTQGTSIGSAINMAIRSFGTSEKSNRAIVVITDGENHEEGAINAAQKAADMGIVVHTIGMGDPQGSPIPIQGQYGQKEFWKDNQGNVVITKLNEEILKQIAAIGNGMYISANNTRVGINALFDEIDKLNKEEIEAKTYSEYEEQYQYPLAVAILLILIELAILERKNKKLMGVRIFNTANAAKR